MYMYRRWLSAALGRSKRTHAHNRANQRALHVHTYTHARYKIETNETKERNKTKRNETKRNDRKRRARQVGKAAKVSSAAVISYERNHGSKTSIRTMAKDTLHRVYVPWLMRA